LQKNVKFVRIIKYVKIQNARVFPKTYDTFNTRYTIVLREILVKFRR